nr:MAG TPA: hypothetical protein [Caudoviricetes sp.]
MPLFYCSPPYKTGEKHPRKSKKIVVPQMYPKCTPKNFSVKNPFSETKKRTA